MAKRGIGFQPVFLLFEGTDRQDAYPTFSLSWRPPIKYGNDKLRFQLSARLLIRRTAVMFFDNFLCPIASFAGFEQLASRTNMIGERFVWT